MNEQELKAVLHVLYDLPYEYGKAKSFVPLVEVTKRMHKYRAELREIIGEKEYKEFTKELFDHER